METAMIIILSWIFCAFLFWRIKGLDEMMCLFKFAWWIPVVVTILSPLSLLWGIIIWVLGIKIGEED